MIVTLAQIKTFLGITSGDMDATLTDWMTLKQAQIEQYVRGRLEEAEVVVYADGTGGNQIRFPVLPFSRWKNDKTAKECVEYKVSPAANWASITTLNEYLIVKNNTHLYYYAGSFPNSFPQNIRLSYRAGYQAADLPPVYKDALYKEVSRMWLDSPNGKARIGLASESTGGGTVNTGTVFLNLSEEVRKMLYGSVKHIA